MRGVKEGDTSVAKCVATETSWNAVIQIGQYARLLSVNIYIAVRTLTSTSMTGNWVWPHCARNVAGTVSIEARMMIAVAHLPSLPPATAA